MLEIPGIFDLKRKVGRRTFLRCCGYGSIASLLNQSTLIASPSPSQPLRPIRSCIVVMLYGGPSQLDTWDLKPQAPAEIRGQYQPISTSVPGRTVCEHLPRLANLVDRLAVVRSMHHGMSNHNSAMYQALVGRRPKVDLDVLGADRASDFPSVGSVLSYMASSGGLPRSTNPLTNVALPHVMHNVVDLPGQNAGFLGGRHDPFQIASDPSLPGFQVPNLNPPADVSQQRMSERLALLRSLPTSAALSDQDSTETYHQRALDLLASDAIQRAFRVDREPAQVRDRYGRNTFGQSLLLARKLIEADVRFIRVNDKIYNGQDTNWDSHVNIFPRHRELLEPFDQGFSALIEDLDQRGLLDSTLVVCTGEFGRTPRVNASGGRDHWPDCYSVVMAGGGTAPGSTYGESDRYAAHPIADGVTPADLAATIFWLFGVDWRLEIHDQQGRPWQLAEGTPIKRLFPSAE